MDYINGLTYRGFCIDPNASDLPTGWHKTKSGSWICIDLDHSAASHTLPEELQAAITAANKQETINPQPSLKYTKKH